MWRTVCDVFVEKKGGQKGKLNINDDFVLDFENLKNVENHPSVKNDLKSLHCLLPRRRRANSLPYHKITLSHGKEFVDFVS